MVNIVIVTVDIIDIITVIIIVIIIVIIMAISMFVIIVINIVIVLLVIVVLIIIMIGRVIWKKLDIRDLFPRATGEGFLLCGSSAGAELCFPGGARGLPGVAIV